MKRTFLPIYIPLSLLQKGLKRNRLKRNRLNSSCTSWKIQPSLFPNNSTVDCLTFIIRNSYKNPWSKNLLILIPWLLPATVLHLLPLPGNGSIVFVIVPLKVSMTVPVTAAFPSLILTSDGIPPVPVFIIDTIYICWLLLIQKATFRFFLY